MPTSLTTRSFDNSRTGANLTETVQTPARLRAQGIRHLGDMVLQDDARGTEGQPLIIPGLLMDDGLVHEVAFITTMANDVYAFDTTSMEVLWKQRLGNPVVGTRQIDMYLINQNWGITSTGVIDLATQRLFVVAMSSPDGTIGNAQFYLHGLNIADGSQGAAPVDLNTATYQPPNGLPLQRFSNVARKQRAGLAFDSRNGVDTVFVCAGSFNEDEANQGWVVACDVSGGGLRYACAWASSSRYEGGGIWMGAQAPAVDPAGYVKFMTGNGAYDGITDFGNSFVKLRYTPKAGATAASLVCVDFVAFYTDTGLVGGDPTLAALGLIPGYDAGETMLPTNARNFNDQDLGSGGLLHLPTTLTGFATNLDIGAGKDGRGFIVRSDDMGQPPLSWFAQANMAKVYACAAGPIGWFTYWQPGNPMPIDVTQLDVTYAGKTHHQHSTPTYYKSPRYGNMVYCWGENGNLRAWQIEQTAQQTYQLNYLGCSIEWASAEITAFGGGMPGGMVTMSANGAIANTGIVWATIPYGNGNTSITNGRLLAYAADAFEGGVMVKLWDSQDWGITFMFSKFNLPVCCNGKLYVPSYDGRVMVFG